MRNAFSSLRARVLLLIAIPFAVLLSTTIYHMLDMREDRLTNARMHVLDTARVMAGEQQRIIDHIHQMLSAVALLPEVRRGVASEECRRALAVRYQQEQNLISITLALANGDVICTTAVPTAQRINLADRDHFKAAILTREFSVGGYVIGRNTGRPGIGFALPLLDDAGVPRTVVATTLSLAWLEQELAKAQLPAGSRVVVMDGEGLVLARHPDPEQQVGKSAVDLPLWRNILAKGSEGTEEGIDQDGLQKIYGFVPLHRTASGQAYLWISIPKDAVTGPVERAFVLSLLVAVALLVLTFGAVWLGGERFFVRRMAALAGAAKELGEGNLATRIGFKACGDEIGQLAQSFNRMAERLQTKETQLSGAVRALRMLSAGNHAMLHAKQGEQQLLEEMCRVIGEAGGYRLGWVGYAENDTEKSIRRVAHWGSVVDGYFENVKLTWSDTESGRTPAGRAIRTGKPAVVQNIQRETGPQAWQDDTLRCGCGACLALPLRIDDRVIGVLNICAEETDAFSAEEVGLLSEAAADLSFGIASQRAEVEHVGMKVTLRTAEERFRAATEASLDALFILKSVRDKAGHLVDFECIDINGHAAEMLGMARERIIGQKLCELLPHQRTGGFLDKYAQVVATGTPLEEEFPIDTPEIKAKWLRHQVVRMDDGIAVFARDVTSWRESGARLKESQLTLIQSNRALRTLSACNEALTHAVSEPELLNAVCRLAVESGGYCMAWVRYAQQDAAKTVCVVAQHGSEEGYLESRNITWADTEQGRGPTGTAIRTGTTQVNQNMLTNPNMAPWREEALACGFQSSMAMPLKGPSGTLGALTLYARECDAFDADEVQLLEKLADDLAFGITTLRTRVERDRMAYAHQHHDEILRKSLEESIQAIASTLEMRDPYTAGHQKRVAKLAVAIASDLGLPKDEVHGIQLAASIHDLGKIQVPAEILSKPSKLSDIEFMLIKTHAQAGYDILKGIEFPWPIANIVLQHHEKLDGSGYPQGLKGDQILLGSRIIAVADVLEAMASHRPYRPSLGIEVALKEIERGSGTVYDPAVVDACLKLFRQQEFTFQI